MRARIDQPAARLFGAELDFSIGRKGSRYSLVSIQEFFYLTHSSINNMDTYEAEAASYT
ncbi:MAG: hypothetical protein KTR25_01450 [Myxococcales bacterium]|nr:hypothetical protein [Myxococcales bacterium]